MKVAPSSSIFLEIEFQFHLYLPPSKKELGSHSEPITLGLQVNKYTFAVNSHSFTVLKTSKFDIQKIILFLKNFNTNIHQ
jgi:hypothetical protein